MHLAKRQSSIQLLAQIPVCFRVSDLSPSVPGTIKFVICLSAISHHLPQLPFLRELTAENVEIVDEVFAGLHEGSTRGEATIGLNAENELAAKADSISVGSKMCRGLPEKEAYATSGCGTL